MERIIKDKRLYICFLSCLIIGLLCHGYCMFNKLSIGDDIQCIKSFGATFTSGRWMLGILEMITNKLHIINYSISLYNGLLLLFYISISVYLIICGINITSTIQIVLLSGIMISFPTVTSSFGYLFTSPSYFFGVLLSLSGAFIYHKNKNFYSIVLCSLLMCCSVGIYQANIPICISALLIFMLEDIMDGDYDFKDFIKLTIQNVVICISFILLYFIINNLFLTTFDLQLSDYKGINTFGKTSIIGYIDRIINAYLQFVNPGSHSAYANMFMGINLYIYLMLVIITAILLLVVIIKNHSLKNIELLIVYAFIPLAAYFIFVMVDDGEIHSLMTYGYVFLIISMFMLINYVDIKHSSIIKQVYYMLFIIMIVLFGRLSNVCYFKTAIFQENSINYFNRLAMRIESAEGYNSAVPIVYINENKKNTNGFSNDGLFEESYLVPYLYYNGSMPINNDRWRMAMSLWCGFDPNVKNDGVTGGGASTATIDMPCYPEDGSIKIIDGILYVKFADD